MSVPAPALDWGPIAETLAAMNAERGAIDELVEDLFAELEKRRGELAQQAVELKRHRQEADARRRELYQEREANLRLAQQFEQQEKQLAEALALLEEVKRDLDEAPARGDLSADAARLQSDAARAAGERDAVLAERDALRAELEALRAAAPQWAKFAADIERWGGSLEERLQNLARPAASASDSPAVAHLEQERAALIAELEQVRTRSAELHESLREQQREHAEQNARFAHEIQQLRELVERQAELLMALPREASSAVPGESGDPAAPRSEAAAPAADPVVSSVMAQFAQLQKDVAKRRKRK